MSIGGEAMKPKPEEKIPLPEGVHAVKLKDVVSGLSDKTGNLYWINKLETEDGDVFDHFINTTPTDYKPIEKIFKAASEQMITLMLYDKIGVQDDYDAWFQKAIDQTYALVGKKIEYTVKNWEFNGKKGKWGRITGYLDVPNEAVQTLPETAEKTFDSKEELPF